METHIQFKAGDVVLEALLKRSAGDRAAVITHPHPLYGGDMHNPVVETIGRIYQNRGFTTLRFNFRGVGASTGSFTEGFGEMDDVRGAIGYLIQAGIEKIDLSGYSFGTRVLAGMSLPEQVIRQIYVAPPVAFMDFSEIAEVTRLAAVVVGDSDDFAPVADIKNLLHRWGSSADLHVISGGDHFFSSCQHDLISLLEKTIS